MNRNQWGMMFCYVVLGMCLVLSFFAWRQAREQVAVAHQSRFIQAAMEMQDTIKTRITSYKNSLYGARALFESTAVNRQTFQAYAHSLDIPHHFSGLAGFGFIRSISASEEAVFATQMRREGLTSFTIHPVGKRNEYAPITYTSATTSPTASLLGFDVYSDPVRTLALTQARKTGDVSITDKVLLASDNSSQKDYAFIMYLPVYQQGQLYGYVYVPSRFADLFTGIDRNNFIVQIADSTNTKHPKFLAFPTPSNPGSYMTTLPLYVGSRVWLLKVQSTILYDASLPGDNIPDLVLGFGITVSLLLFSILYSIVTQRNRAVRLAEKMTEEIRRNEQKYRTIFEALQDVYYETDSNGTITTVSPSIERYTGIPAEKIIGMKASELYMRPKERERLLETVRKEGFIIDYEVTLKGREGKPLAVSVTAKAMCDAHGKICGISGMLRDITRRKHAEEALQRKNNELQKAHEDLHAVVKKLRDDKRKLEEAMTKDEFLSMAAHELRTPLGTIRWRLETVLAGKVPSQIREKLEKNYRNILQLIELVNNLLDVSRVNQGRIKDSPDMIDAVSFLDSTKEAMLEYAKERGVSIQFHYQEKTIPMVIDQDLFGEVLTNLLSNAIKYNKPNGKVDVFVKVHGHHVILTVQDTGIGIPKKDQKSVFEKFHRGSNIDTNAYEGTGLGLFVVKSYVERWQGTIHLKSIEGKGTTVTIELPQSTQ